MNFKKILKFKKISQVDLAGKVNVTQSLISQWVKGACQPQLEMLPKLAKALDVTIEEVVNCFNKKEEE